MGDLAGAVLEWIGDRADLMTSLAGALALSLAVGAIPGVARRRALARLTWRRWRACCAGLAGSGLSPPTFGEQLRRSALRFDGLEINAAWELAWLSERLGLQHGFTFDDSVGTVSLQRMALDYRKLSARLRARSLLGVVEPMIESEAQLAFETYLVLTAHANRIPQAPLESFAVAPRHGRFAVEIITNDDLRPIGEHDLTISWRRSRIDSSVASRSRQIFEQDASEVNRRALGSPRLEELRERLSTLENSPYHYDGLLPRIMGFRTERDKRNGSAVLHLSLGEISYFAHQILSHPDSGLRERSTCLTLSLLIVTADNRLVLVRRSSAAKDQYSGQLAPSVNGNLEIPTVGGDRSDSDRFGIPDLRRAIQRESVEEIGLEIPSSYISLAGLARLVEGSEVGTFVLAMTARVEATADEIQTALLGADVVHGGWERSGGAEFVHWPTGREQALALMSRAWRADDVMPHLAIAISVALINEGLLSPDEVGQVDRQEPLGHGFLT